MLVFISAMAAIGTLTCTIAAAVVLRGHRVFLSCVAMTLYRIATGDVALIEINEEEESHD